MSELVESVLVVVKDVVESSVVTMMTGSGVVASVDRGLVAQLVGDAQRQGDSRSMVRALCWPG